MPGQKQQSFQAQEKEQDKKAETAPPSISGTPHTMARLVRRSSRRQAQAGVLIIVLMLGVVVLLAFFNGNTYPSTQADISQAAPTTPVVTPVGTASRTSTPLLVKTVRRARQRLFPFPASNVGLMQPAVDVQGNVWVGEMYANRLAHLNSHTGAITTWQPPSGQFGLMTTAVDAQGKVWFVEQGANYIGRFDPTSQMFHIFPLGTINGRHLGPQDLQFDDRGFPWFTAVIGGRIGRLDPITGVVATWPVPSPSPGTFSNPFSLTVTSAGQVWFGDITGGVIGHLDSSTGHITLYHLASAQAEVFAMAHDSTGHIWFTEIAPGALGMIDTTTNRITEWPIPDMFGRPAALYGLVVMTSGDVWFVDNSADALVRFLPGKPSYLFYRIALSSSAPFGLTLGSGGTLWFTAPGSAVSYVGMAMP